MREGEDSFAGEWKIGLAVSLTKSSEEMLTLFESGQR